MSKKFDHVFTSEDLKRIEAAVREAEKQTSGEIVPYVVHASDPYDDALWRSGLLFGILTLTTFVVIHSFSQSWETFELVQVGIGTLAAGLAGVALTRFSETIRRFFAGSDLIERRTAQRAAEAFLAEEVFNTRDRTGILLFLSLLEHKVIVLGDSGINAKVQKAEWEDVAKTIVNGMRTGKPADGLIDAIRQCGELLKREGVAIKPDDKNEISDQMRMSDR
jgi:putative membrane protein